jgi:hypothetical protein
MATNGTAVLLWANVSATPTLIGGQRDLSISEATETIDFSTKGAREQVVQGGRYSSEVTLDALWIAADAAYGELLARLRDGELVTIRTKVSAANDEEATGIVTSVDRSYPDQGASVVSVTIAISGSWGVAA